MRPRSRLLAAAAIATAISGGLTLTSDAFSAPDGSSKPAGRAVATFGGGCFWCLEAVFEEVAGVDKVVSGYAGGQKKNPTYHEVCDGDTGHAEVVQITYDTAVVSYDELLAIFFSIHDPTTVDRQGADVGSQYRSIILTHDDAQAADAQSMMSSLTAEKVFDKPLATKVVPLTTFYPAEEYHQDYYRRNPAQGYCQAVIAPKMAKFRRDHAEQLKGGGGAARR